MNPNNFFRDLSFDDVILLKQVLLTFEESCDRELSEGNEEMRKLRDWAIDMRAKLSPYIAAAMMKKSQDLGMINVDDGKI